LIWDPASVFLITTTADHVKFDPATCWSVITPALLEKNQQQTYRPKHYILRSDSSMHSYDFLSSLMTVNIEGHSSSALNLILPFISASTVNLSESIRSCLSVELLTSSDIRVAGNMPQVYSSRLSLSFFEKNRITFKSSHPFEKNFAIFYDLINSIGLKQTADLQECTQTLNLKYPGGSYVNFNVLFSAFLTNDN
jgi:hypothetical protein